VATRLKVPLSPTVVYFYGITGKSAAGLELVGVDGKSPVVPIACASLLCWISLVPREEFADNLAKNMEDLDWLSEAGVRHQRVVAGIAQAADILPARFGIVFLNVSSLKRDVLKRKKLLLANLRKVSGSDEWGVKIFAVQRKVEVPWKRPASGRDYLKRKAALLRRPAMGAVEDLQSFVTALRRISADLAEAGKIGGGQRDLQWQSSLLLKRAHRKKLEALLKKQSAKWEGSARIECTGPWPPYSFVSR
jgi:hypothetical protein